MTGRDRMVVIGVVLIVVLGAMWMLVVSPERQKASSLASQVTAAQAQLSSAEGQVASARQAQSRYAAAYASIVNLGKAVPASQEVPSLIYQLAEASESKQVNFASIASSSTSGVSGGGASGGSSAAGSAPGGFTQMPFTFIFNGTFVQLEHLFAQLNRFTVRTPAGHVRVSGRLLTIQSVKLSPQTAASSGHTSGPPELGGTITATAYVLPPSQGLTGSGSASSSAGTASPASGGATSSPTAPATARVIP
ncbi:MAG TPA: type II secretion system protein GspM [Solirubrobacteraceae bacterium]|nr:type II secretion system protein GspM [Solirubrobacteraceae bacterium]